MKTRIFPLLALLAVSLAACAPAGTATATNPPVPATVPATVALPTQTLAAPTLEPATQPALTEAATALPIATSRGSDLAATDPTTVSLASGGLQFVEFFRFT